jgi:hypothetical protein
MKMMESGRHGKGETGESSGCDQGKGSMSAGESRGHEKQGGSGGCKCCQPAEDEIARRAYQVWLAHGATHGCDINDWLEAECELRRVNRQRRHAVAA